MTREDPSHTRRRIVEAVTALVTEEHPAAISVPAVARRAGVSVATVYRYFPNKEQLLDAAVMIGNERTAEVLDGTTVDADALDELIAQTFGELAEHLPLVRNQQHSEAGRALRTRRRAVKRRHLRRSITELGLDPDSHEGARLVILVELLASSTVLLELHDHLGLGIDEAAAHVAWAIRALTRETGRST